MSPATPPQDGKPGRYDAFLSYAREDGEFAERLVEALAAKDQRVWLDVQDIPGGADWRRYQTRALEACKAFVFLLSPDSVTSKHCLQELEQARSHEKLVIPVYHRDVDERGLPPAIGDPEWIFLREGDRFEEGVEKLVESLHVDHDWREQHTRLATRAREWEDSQRDKSYLLRGVDLAEAEHWLGTQGGHRQTPTALQAEFIISSRRSAIGRQRRLALVIATALIFAIALAVFAFLQRGQAIDQKRSAQSRSLAVRARELARTDLDAGALLALEANRLKPTLEARAALLSIVPDLQRARPVFSQGISSLPVLGPDDDQGEIALSEAGGTIRWLTLASGEVVSRETVPKAKRYAPVPSANGKLLAYGGSLSDVWLWDRQRQAVVAHLHDELAGSPIYGLTFSPDNRMIAVRHETGIRLWDTRRNVYIDLSPPRKDHVTYLAQAAEFSPDGKLLARGASNGCAYVWKVSGGVLPQPGLCGKSPVTAVAFSHAGDRLAVGQENGTVMIWQLDRPAKPSAVAPLHRGSVAAIAFNRADDAVASAGEDGTLSLWDGRTGRLAEYRIERNSNISDFSGQRAFDAVAFDASGETLVTVSGGKGRSWDASRGDAFGEQVGDEGISSDGRNDYGNAVSPDGQLVASRSFDGPAMVWNRRSGERVELTEAGDPGPLEFSSDGRAVAAQTDGQIVVWNARSGAIEHAITHTLDPTVIGSRQSSALSPDGKLIVTTKDFPEDKGEDFGVQVWKVADGTLVKSLPSPFDYETSDVAFSPDASLLAGTGIGRPYRGTIQLWDTESWEPVTRRSIGQSQEISGMAFSPDSKVLATAGDPGPVRLWSVPDLEPLGNPIIADVDVVPALAFSPDGKTLATGGEDGKIRLWDVATQELLGRPLPAHSQYVDTLSFSSDGKELISVGNEGVVHTWDSILWSADLTQLERFVCAAVGHHLPPAEWQRLIPEVPYRSTCSL